jgi:DNA polymerase-3 subunit delta'
MVEKRPIDTYFDQQKEIPGQTFALFGPAGSGKKAFCYSLAKRLLDTTKEDHPDLITFKPQGKLALHSINEMRRLSDEARRKPHVANYVIIVVEEAEKMLPASANALLKTFEEPHQQCLIFLLSSESSRLLPTLLSRCKKFYLQNPNTLTEHPSIPLIHDLLSKPPANFALLKEQIQAIVKTIETKKEKPKSAKSDLSPYQKEQIEKNQDGEEAVQYQQDCHNLLEAILLWHQKQPSLPYALQCVEEANTALKRQLPLQHTLESLFLKLKR